MSDVPVGAFLSGGIDSGALVGMMRDCGVADLRTMTLAFREFTGSNDDESRIAEEIARTYGTRHSTRIVDAEEFHGDLDKIVAAMDQPTIDGINSWFVSKAAHELGLKVVVSGLGGDELFGGYPSFRVVPRLARTLNPLRDLPRVRTAVRRAVSKIEIGRFGLHPKLAGLPEYAGSLAGSYLLQRGLFMPWELAEVQGEDEAREGLSRLDVMAIIEGSLSPEPADAFHAVSALESSLYMRNQLLRDIDWEVRSGECWIVRGANGAGKSTLLRTIYGDHPVAAGGRLQRAGIELGVPLSEFKQRCGIVAPQLQTDYPRDTPVQDVVISGLHASIGLNEAPDARERSLAARALELCGAGALRERRLASLSYGQVRRVLFARALVAALRSRPASGCGSCARWRWSGVRPRRACWRKACACWKPPICGLRCRPCQCRACGWPVDVIVWCRRRRCRPRRHFRPVHASCRSPVPVTRRS